MPASDAAEGDPDRSALAHRLLAEHGRTLAAEAGITLRDEPAPLWQLLVLAQLLSARIPSGTAIGTARELRRARWTTPEHLLAAGRSAVVTALGRGGYRRYDESTATRLRQSATLLEERWGGDLRRLRDEAGGQRVRIAALLREFAGIGPTGADIFLREVQEVWPDVRPAIDALVRRGARAVGLPTAGSELAALVPGADLARLCAALVRVARDPELAAAADPPTG